MTDAGRSRHLVDPELAPLLDLLPTISWSTDVLAAARDRPAWLPVDPADLARTSLEKRLVPGPDGAPDVPVAIYRPADLTGALPCILHIHGGGYIAGSAAQLEGIHRPLAADLGCAIISVDYRLAPENPFPAAIEDCYAALRWLSRTADDLGVDAGRTGVMGESAGGGLAAALALLARDRGDYALAFQHLIYPMIDDRTCRTATLHPFAGEYVWTAESNVFGWTSLLGHAPGGDGTSPYAAAARATDLAGLPPTFIATGALDLFVDEDIDYATRLIRAGVPTELHVYPGAFHAFNIAPGSHIAANARRDSREALRRALR